MSIKSIDMQVLVQKTGDVAKIQQAHRLENENRQQEFSQQINQETERNTKTVNQPLHNKFEYVHNRKEREKEKKSKTQKGKKDKSENKKSGATVALERGNNLDITV